MSEDPERTIAPVALRKIEHFYRYIGFIQRKRQVYVSDFNLSIRRAQAASHQRFFERFDEVNELGEILALEDAVANASRTRKTEGTNSWLA